MISIAPRLGIALAVFALPLALALPGCSSGLGNNLRTTTEVVADSSANMPTGLDIGVTPTDPISSPAIAGAVIPGIGGGDPREVVFLAFVTSSSATDADGSGTPLARESVTDNNGASDVFVAAILEDSIDETAFSQSLAGKFRHPRCSTCHSMQAADTMAFVSSPQAHAGPPPGPTFPNNDPATCAPCHVTSTSFPVEGWQAPAASFDFRNKTVAELAAQAMNVPADETEHFVTDKRVLWALNSGILPAVNGRNGIADDDHDGVLEPEDTDGTPRTVPGGSTAFLEEIEAWNAGGNVISTASAVHDIALVSQTAANFAGNGASTAPRMVFIANSSFNPTSATTAAATNPIGTLYVVYESEATDLAAGDGNSVTDVYRAVVQVRAEEGPTGTATAGRINLMTVPASNALVSARDGTSIAGNAASTVPSIGGTTGNLVVFESLATDLVGGFVDTNGASETDIWIRDLDTGDTALVSHSTGGAAIGGNGLSTQGAISENGNAIAFSSAATDIVAGDTNAVTDVFYGTVTAGPTIANSRASLVTGGVEATGGACSNPSVCEASGRILVGFESNKTDLVASVGTTNNVYLFDSTGSGTTTLLNQVIRQTGATLGDGDASNVIIAQDGAMALFQSDATNLDVLRDDTNRATDVFAVSLTQFASESLLLPFRVSITGSHGAEADGNSTNPMFGTFAGASSTYETGFAAFTTAARNLGTSDTTSLVVSFLNETSGVLVDFSATPTSGALPLTVQFTDTSSGNPDTWAWDFNGDSVVDSTERNPSYTYRTAGNFSVTLTASNRNSEGTKTSANFIRAYGPSVPDFTASTTSGAAPLAVTFTDTSTEDPTSWAWDFDGDSVVDSTVQNPSFTYTSTGTYNVTLTVTGVGGGGSTTKTGFISVFDPVAADFSGTPLTGMVPLDVAFTDLTTGNPTSWAWDFDGDTIVDSTLQNPTFQYTTPGNYTVSLTATGPGGSDTETKVSYVAANGPVVADFTVNQAANYLANSFTFTDTSTGTISSWAWDFDGDMVTDSTLEAPAAFTYSSAGTYTVTLTVSGPGGSDDETKVNFITVVEDSVTVSLGAAKDTTIYSDATGNSNALGDYIFAGNAALLGTPNTFQGIRRALIEFDVAGTVPSGATILSASLTLNNSFTPTNSTGNRTFSLRPVSTEWGEATSDAGTGGGGGVGAATGDATWTAAVLGTTNWSSSGGDFGGVSSSRSVNAAGSYTWTGLASDVQTFLDTSSNNHGWILLGPNEGTTTRTAKRFDSKDHPTPANRPSLSVTYQPPLP